MANVRSALTQIEDFACPNCGAWEFKGGCKDSQRCEEAIARTESEYGGEITAPVSRANRHPLQLVVAGLEALDLLDIGLVVADSAGRAFLVNRTADHIFKARDGLELTARAELRTLKGCGPSLTGLMRQAGRARSVGTTEKDSAAAAIRRPSGKRPLTLLARSIKSVSSFTSEPAKPAVLVFILDPEPSGEAGEAALRQLYRLTSAEIRLANLLMDGKTLEDCCLHLGVCRSTLCTHLQNLFRKTGAKRQSQLVALLLKNIGLLRSGHGCRANRENAESTCGLACQQYRFNCSRGENINQQHREFLAGSFIRT